MLDKRVKDLSFNEIENIDLSQLADRLLFDISEGLEGESKSFRPIDYMSGDYEGRKIALEAFQILWSKGLVMEDPYYTTALHYFITRAGYEQVDQLEKREVKNYEMN